MNLVSKHDFTMVSFGAMCGLLYNSLQELTILRCSDFFNVNSGAFGTIACLKKLQSLRIEDLHCRVDPENVGKLSKMTQVSTRCSGNTQPSIACPPISDIRRCGALCCINDSKAAESFNSCEGDHERRAAIERLAKL